MASEKERSSIGEDMSSADKDYEDNEPEEMNEPVIFDNEPLILDKEYNLENNKNSNNLNNDKIEKQIFSLIKKKK